MTDEQVETPLEVRVERVRTDLAHVASPTETYRVLSGADLAVLRMLEENYFHHPGPASSLRERVAKAHVELMTRRERWGQARDTKLITASQVAQWAVDTLGEWLPGYTDFDAALGGQYRLAVQRDIDSAHFQSTVEVSTVDRYDPRRFRLRLLVEAL